MCDRIRSVTHCIRVPQIGSVAGLETGEYPFIFVAGIPLNLGPWETVGMIIAASLLALLRYWWVNR